MLTSTIHARARLKPGLALALTLTQMLTLTMKIGLSAQTGASVVTGRVTLPSEVAPVARRPDVRGLGMPQPRNATPRGRSVVYLEVAPREAFEGTGTAQATVDQRDETFVPHLVAVEAGSRVDFPNSDETYHNVFSLSPGGAFDLGRYAAGRSKSVRFDHPGIVRVFCDIHSHMNAFVLVFGHRFFAVTDEDGRYRMDGVPPGRYTVTTWHERFGTVTESVEVPADGHDVELNFSFPGG